MGGGGGEERKRKRVRLARVREGTRERRAHGVALSLSGAVLPTIP
jgi:hypothetical protein